MTTRTVKKETICSVSQYYFPLLKHFPSLTAAFHWLYSESQWEWESSLSAFKQVEPQRHTSHSHLCHTDQRLASTQHPVFMWLSMTECLSSLRTSMVGGILKMCIIFPMRTWLLAKNFTGKHSCWHAKVRHIRCAYVHLSLILSFLKFAFQATVRRQFSSVEQLEPVYVRVAKEQLIKLSLFI